jgi:hypothetical protein
MVKNYHRKAEFITAVITGILCLASISFGTWGLVVSSHYGRMWWVLVAGGVGGLLISLIWIADALGIIDYFVN